MRLRCKKCGLIWEYKGSREYATCPNCHTKNRVGMSYIEDDAEEPQERTQYRDLDRAYTRLWMGK